MEIGYAFSSEEHTPADLVAHARAAEDAGFTWGLISDHIHPWVDAQGHSPFVWTTVGAILQATEGFRIGTGVTCPTIRVHPAIVAHAAATCATLAPGRFFLGVGTGENLNEHVTGARWPFPDERLELLEEAIELMRLLWQGGVQTHRGKHYTVDHARIYDLPDEPVEVYVAAAQPLAAELAGRLGDGLISTAPDEEVVQSFRSEGGGDKPRIGMMHVCWREDEAEARRYAHEVWPNGGLTGSLSQELALPEHFEQAAQTVTEDDVAESVPCGPDPEPILEQIREYEQAGFDHVYIHQVGPNQEEFLRFAQRELLARV